MADRCFPGPIISVCDRRNPQKSGTFWAVRLTSIRRCLQFCAGVYLTDIRRFGGMGMAKTLKEVPLTTRSARAKLPVGLHWRGIDPETHLGYSKGVRGGVWLVRWRIGTGYRQDRLGTADDELSEGTLDYNGAIRAARDRVEGARLEDRAASAGQFQTVRTAIVSYCAERDARFRARGVGNTGRKAATSSLERYVIGREASANMEARAPAPIADVPLHLLTERELIGWRKSLPDTLKTSSVWHLAATLKAAINSAFRANRATLPATLPGVLTAALVISRTNPADGESVARENQILDAATVGRIIAAAKKVDEAAEWGGDLYRMIVVLAATGARFSQAARLTVRDVQIERSRLMIPPSYKGQGRKPEATPVPIGADVLAVLGPAIEDRGKGELLLTRRRMERAPGQLKWVANGRRPWGRAARLVEPWAEIRKIAELERDIVPYALRHSSIVRGIRAGLPLRLVAALHDTSVEMIERHYGRWIADGLDDMAARAVVPLMPAD